MAQAAKSLLLAATMLSPALAHADVVKGFCAGGLCSVMLTPGQLLAKATQLVEAHQYEQARPMVAALGAVPSLALETQFLSGFIAAETGDLDGAIAHYRAALVNHPKATQVRLQLAKVLMLRGRDGAADYNYRLAQQDPDLPPQLLETIKAQRNLLRDRRPWHLTADFGIAPDSNITGATNAETIDLTTSTSTKPIKLTLGGNARARSGLGQTGSLSVGYRFHLAPKLALITDADAQGVNYEGSSADDFTGQVAVGPELRVTDSTTLSLQGIGNQRWYGGVRAATQFGLRGQVERLLDQGQRIGFTLDARHSNSGFSPDYDGWTLGSYASYERVVGHAMIANATLFARTDRLHAPMYSNREYGVSLGMGGEFIHGINAGLSGGVSRASYDATQVGFARTPRLDWRYNARVYLGLRSLKLAGLSPSVTFTYSKIDSSLVLYASDRKRVAFALAKYF